MKADPNVVRFRLATLLALSASYCIWRTAVVGRQILAMKVANAQFRQPCLQPLGCCKRHR